MLTLECEFVQYNKVVPVLVQALIVILLAFPGRRSQEDPHHTLNILVALHEQLVFERFALEAPFSSFDIPLHAFLHGINSEGVADGVVTLVHVRHHLINLDILNHDSIEVELIARVSWKIQLVSDEEVCYDFEHAVEHWIAEGCCVGLKNTWYNTIFMFAIVVDAQKISVEDLDGSVVTSVAGI